MHRIMTLACAPILLAALIAASPAAASDLGKARVIHDGDGNAVRITVIKTKVVAATSKYFKPEAGQRWFGAYIRVRNLSKERIDDCAGNDAELIGSDNGQYDHASEAEAKPELQCFKLPAGRTQEGWVVWEIPKRIKPKFIDWTMDAGFADETASWKL